VRKSSDVGFPSHDFWGGLPLMKCVAVPTVAFKVYDVDRDGFISNGELFLVLKMMVGNNLKASSRS